MAQDSRATGRSHAPRLRVLAIALAMAVAACSAAAPTPTPVTRDPSLAASPMPTATPSPMLTATPSPSLSPSPDATPTHAAPATWIYNVYDSAAVRWQDPDMTACTAASALIMLNMATYWPDYSPHAGGHTTPLAPTGWKIDTSYDRMETLLAYQRKTGTMLLSWPGADAHGWRNSLNYYGWGNMKADVYRDMAFGSFAAAATATVMAVALYRKPVGILGWAGDHAQIVTGYKVYGDDPRIGATGFTILGVYLTDPLKKDGYRNSYISLATWKSGGRTIRFTPYTMTNSPYKDPIDGQLANSEWDGKWVIVAPVA